MNASGAALSRNTRGLRGMRGASSAASVALSLFGGKWGGVLSIATMFAPEIIKGTKSLFNFRGAHEQQQRQPKLWAAVQPKQLANLPGLEQRLWALLEASEVCRESPELPGLVSVLWAALSVLRLRGSAY
ncbi:hypothetical protein QKW52_04605 [Bacillus sonorensis]|nr:hypothetical protein [Bacillus sonorensis]